MKKSISHGKPGRRFLALLLSVTMILQNTWVTTLAADTDVPASEVTEVQSAAEAEPAPQPEAEQPAPEAEAPAAEETATEEPAPQEETEDKSEGMETPSAGEDASKEDNASAEETDPKDEESIQNGTPSETPAPEEDSSSTEESGDGSADEADAPEKGNTESEEDQEEPEASPTPVPEETVRENIVTFQLDPGVRILVNGVDTGTTAKALDGKIIFTIKADESHEVTEVLVDGSIPARKNTETPEDDDYIIEGIQTDDTIVTVKTREKEPEETPEPEKEPGAEEPGTEEPEATGTPEEPGEEKEPEAEEPGEEGSQSPEVQPGGEGPGIEEPGIEEPDAEEPGTEGEEPEDPEEGEGEEASTPAVELACDAEGASISISAAEGVLPEGTTMSAEPTNAWDTIPVHGDGEDGITLLKVTGADITLYDAEGNVVQPDGAVTVTISGLEVPEGADWAAVYHVSGGEAEKIAEVTPAETVSFTTDHFSVYAVAFGIKGVSLDPSMGEEPGISVISITGDREVKVGGAITLKSDVKNGSNHVWTSDNEEAAIVEKVEDVKEGNATFSVATVKGIATGTATITHTYGGDNKETFNVTVINAGEEGEGSTAYFYIWKPDLTSGNYTQTYKYANTGKVVSSLGEARTHVTGSKYTPVSAYVKSYPSTLPDMEYNGNTYKWDPTGVGGPDKYVVDWEYVVVSNGANNGNDIVVQSGTPTYHVDGRCIFPPKLEITKTVSNDKAKIGDELIYTITVKNTGSKDLDGITLQDVFTGTNSLTWSDGKEPGSFNLAAGHDGSEGETKTFTATYIVQKEDAGKTLTNTATAIYGEERIGDDASTTVENVISTTVKKVWEDKDNQDGIRPNSVTVQLMRDGKVYETADLSASNGWTHTWNDLPESGNYTVVEPTVREGYKSAVTGDVKKGFTVTNTHTPSTLEKGVTVTKVWNDAGNQDGLRPDSVSIQLQQNGSDYGTPVELNETNGWSYTWTGLPEHVAGGVGTDAVYTVVEPTLPEGYSSEVTGDIANGFKVTNTHTPNTLAKGVTVTKVWSDADDQDGLRPDSVSVQLQQNGSDYGDSVELNEANGWSYTWTGLPEHVAGKVGEDAKYTVAEPTVAEGYTSEVTGNAAIGFTVTNTHEPNTLNEGVTVTKSWNDANNQDGIRPGSVSIQLQQNGSDYGTPVELNETNGWSYTWTGLPEHVAGEVGTDAVYTVVELNEPEGYTSGVTGDAATGFTVTNTHTPNTLAKGVTVTKVWSDADDQDGLRPDSVSVQLQQNGTNCGASVELNAANGWSHTWTGLPEHVAGEVGTDAVYTVIEPTVPEGYTSAVTGNVESGFTVTNTHTPNTLNEGVTVTKSWNDANNQDGIRPGSVSVQLKQNGEAYGDAVTLNEANGWSYTWTELPEHVVGEVGTDAVYTVVESTVPTGYTSEVTGDVENGFTVTNTHIPNTLEKGVTVTKVWSDANNQDGLRPNSVSVRLQQDGEPYGDAVTLNEANGWSHTWENLPEHVAGKVGKDAVYTVVESTVPDGYTSAVTGNITDGFTVTNTHELSTLNEGVTVTKSWNDANNQDGIRPGSVSVQLKQNGEAYGAPVELNEENNWTCTWENLPEYVKGQTGVKAIYTVAEPTVPEGYDSVVTGDAKDGFTVTNTHTPNTLEKGVTVTKEWDDAYNQDGLRPHSVSVQLQQNEEPYGDPVELNEENSWTYTWEDLPAYVAGEVGIDATYTVAEPTLPEGYTSDVNGDAETGFTVTNSHTPEVYENVSVKKVWIDDNNRDGKREPITVQLLQDGSPYRASVVLNDENDWTGSWVDVPKFVSGEEAEYTVEETNVPEGYTSSDPSGSAANGFTITNTYTPETISVSVTKEWDDAGNLERPESVTVQLQQQRGENDVIGYLSPVILGKQKNGEVSWSYTWSDLPKYVRGKVGVEAKYTVVEQNVPDGYTADYKGTQETGLIVTNRKEVSDWKVEKEVGGATGEGSAVVGDVLRYTVTVTNTGNTPITESLEDVFTVDGEEVELNLTSNPPLNEDGTFRLEKNGDSIVFSAEYTVKATDKELVNVASVGDKEDQEETSVEDKPGWMVKKTVSGMTGEDGKAKVGDTLTYTVTVTNTGNVPITERLKDVFTVDGTEKTLVFSLNGKPYTLDEEFTVEKGAAAVFTAEYVVGATDSELHNMADVGEVKDDVSTSVENQQAWTVEKSVTGMSAGDMAQVGDTLIYTVTVTNTGNTSVTLDKLSDVFKVDGEEVPLDIYLNGEPYDGGAFTIEKGEAATFTASYIVGPKDNNLLNTAAAGDQEKEVSTEVAPEPAWTVTKTVTGMSAGEKAKVGDTLIYEITVENTGNTSITEALEDIFTVDGTVLEAGLDLKWKDTGAAYDGEEFTLSEGEKAVFTAEYKVKATDKELSNLAVVGDQSGNASTTVEDEPGLTAEKVLTNTGSAEGGKFKAGDKATFDIIVKNTGNTTQTNVRVSEQLPGAVITEGTGYEILDGQAVIGELKSGAEVVVKAEYTVTQEDIDDSDTILENIAAVTGEGGTDPDPELIPEEEQKPGLTAKKELTNKGTGKDGAFAVGETATFDITVTNTGNTTQKNVKVSEMLPGAEILGGEGYGIVDGQAMIAEIAPEQSVVVKAQCTVTQEDIDNKAPLMNTALVDGDNGEEPDPTPETEIPEDDEPGLSSSKTLTNNGGGKNGAFKAGEIAKFEITVSNSGKTTQKNVTVSEMLPGAEILEGKGYEIVDGKAVIAEIAPGNDVKVNAAYMVKEEDLIQGGLNNIAVVKGENPGPDPEESIPTDPKNGHLTITKTTTSTPANGKTYALGETITYKITATNDGNLTLTNVAVTDELTGNIGENAWMIESLAPGKSETFTAKYVVTEADILAGSVLNVATATGTSPDPDTPDVPVDPGEKEDPTDPKNGHLTITKTTTSEPANGTAYALGETITYKITATNDGNLTITDITVTDELTGDSWPVESLAPGESETFTAQHKVTEADILAGSVVNVATATGTSPDPDEPNVPVKPGEKEDPTAPKDGHLTIIKTTTSTPENGEAYVLGETITYEITAKNDGNLTITDIIVTDELTGNQWPIESLEPGDSKNFTAAYVVTEADILAGSVVNMATATGTTPDPDEPEVPVDPGDTEDPTDPKDGHLTITKTTTSTPANGETYALGEIITYTVTATNDGNLTLTDITVTDELTGNIGENAWTIESLAPGESKSFTAEYVVTEADVLAGSVLNVATATGTTPDPDEPEVPVDPGDTEDPTDPKNGHLTITKITTSEPENGETYALGETITYAVTATNDGNLTLTDITVTDELTGDSWTIESLAPGVSETFTAEYVVTEKDILAGSVLNVATGKGSSPDPDTPEVPVDPGDTEDPTDPKNGHLTITKTTTSEPENGTVYALGETITYEITALNDGNLTLTDITVTDELTGDTWQIASLEPGKSETFNAEYVVTEADLIAESVVNVATATGTSPDPEKPEVPVEPGKREDPTSKPAPSLFVEKTAEQKEGGYQAGEVITYTINVLNNGNVTISNITVTDDLTGNTWTIESLAPNDSETFTAEYKVTEADVLKGTVENVATARGTDPDGGPVEHAGDETVDTEEKNGHLTITKTTTSEPAEGEAYALGETITYEIAAENDGNLTLTDITVIDELTGDTWPIESLAPGKSETFTAEYVVTEADVLAGSVLNVATATGTSPDLDTPEVPVDPGDTEDPTDPKNGHLTITKNTTSTPENGETYVLGETITYEIIAENDGNLTLTDITVTDELTGDSWPIASLAPGASTTFTAEHEVTEADVLAGSVLNVATAKGTSPDPDEPDVPVEPGEKEDPTEPKDGHLTITKTTTSEPAEGEAYALGETITYEITALNDGNLTLTDIRVTDELTGDIWPIASLAPGESKTFTAQHEVTEEDILAGSVVNEATATGTSPDPDEPEVPVDPGDTEDPTDPKNGHLTITKNTTSTPANGETYALGETITYEITALNDGNLTLTDITVTDELTGDSWQIESLEPGKSETFPVEYVVTEADVLAGSVLNVATATGTSPDPEEPEVPTDPGETEDPTEPKNGHVTITKTTTSEPADGTAYTLGETITYEITAENDGNLTLTDITVTDELTGDSWQIESLAPGASETFTAEHEVTEADILAGSVVNVATAKGTSPDPDEPEVPTDPGETEDPTEPKDGHVTITKTTTSTPANGETYALGETITYEITAENDGNLTLTDITVTDELTGDSWQIESLAPGASETFTAEHTVTEADILAGSVLNVATATGTSPDPEEPEVPTDPGETEDPTEPKDGHVTITKTTTSTPANGETYALGETITYEITAENDGNLTLTDITVTDELTGDSWQIESLAPGASETFTAEHEVTEADVLAGSVVNVAAATGTSPDPDEPDVPTDPGETEDPTEPKDGHVTITKTTTSEPANGETYALGETITYETTAENDGNLTLIDITVTDELTGDSWQIESLAPGASETFTAEHAVTEADVLAGSVVNVAAATGTSPDPEEPEVPTEPGESEDPTEPKDGHVTITKTTTSTPANGETYALGETITYEITAENDGNLTLTDITVTDELTGDTWQIESLAPGESETFAAEHAVTEADVLAGSVVNVATAAGTSPDPEEPEVPTDPGETEDPTEPKDGHLTITKTATGTPENGTAYALGETITYAVTATNDGNLTLTNVTVTDELTGDTWTIETLAPGESRSFYTSHVVTEADTLAGSVVNVATAAGTSPDPEEPDVPVDPGTEEVPVETPEPSLLVTKTAPAGTYGLGDTVVYTITVLNNSLVEVTNITVEDTLTGDTWTIPSLAAGESQSFTAEHIVTEGDILAGSIVNVATAQGTGPEGEDVTDTVTETVTPEEPDGRLTVLKTAPAGPYGLGETITYTITAQNDGNLTLTGITVTDALTGDAWNIPSLAPGASQTFTAAHVVTESDILAGSVVNVATAEGISPDPENPDVPVTPGTAEVPTVPAAGHLTILKTAVGAPANGTAYVLGETVTYTITALNDGNLTVTDITVTDELTGDAWNIPSLAPGASQSFAAEYVITEADVLAGSVVNVATAEGTSPDPENPDVPVTPGEEQVPVQSPEPSLYVEKTAAQPEDGAYGPGDTITYTIRVVNNGTVTVSNITVTDTLTGDQWTIESLEPGAEQSFTAEYTVTEEDILAGSIVNTALAQGVDPNGEDVTAQDEETVIPEEPVRSLEVEKAIVSTPEDGEAYGAGETVVFDITVQNTGNVTLRNIQVTDSLNGAVILPGEGYTVNGSTALIPELAPGASVVLRAEYVIQESDLGQSFTNIAAAVSEDGTEGEGQTEIIPVKEPEDSTIVVEKQTVDGASGDVLIVGPVTFYAALFADPGLTEMVSGVTSLTLGENQSSVSAAFGELPPGTYYLAETDASGNPIESGELNGGEYVPYYGGGQEITIEQSGSTMTVAFDNAFLTLPEGYLIDKRISITKNVVDENGAPVETDEVFYAGIFSDAEYTHLSEEAEQNIIALSMNGGSSVTADVSVSVPEDGETEFYITEVTPDGTPVENDDSFEYGVEVANG